MTEPKDHRSPEAWNVTSLHHHFCRLLDEHAKRVEERFRSQEQTMKAALANAEKALDKAEMCGSWDMRPGVSAFLIDSEWHQLDASGTGNLSGLGFTEEVSEIDLLAVDLNLCVPLAVFTDRDTAMFGSRSSVTGFVLCVGATLSGNLSQVGTPAVQTVPVDMVAFKAIVDGQSEYQPVQNDEEIYPGNATGCDSIPIFQVPAVRTCKIDVGGIHDGVTLQDVSFATQGDQCSAIAAQDGFASLSPTGSVARTATEQAIAKIDFALGGEERGAALTANAGNGTLWIHREASFPGDVPRAVVMRRGISSLAFYSVTIASIKGFQPCLTL